MLAEPIDRCQDEPEQAVAGQDPAPDATEPLEQLIQLGIALTSERDLDVLLERILKEARRFTRAEAGTLFLLEEDQLRFAVVQNDCLAARLGDREMRSRFQGRTLPLGEPSLAGHVALTGELVNIADAYAARDDRLPFNQALDASNRYQSRSILVAPLREPNGKVLGVLELINARDERGAIVPFRADYERLVRSLASLAAAAIRNTKLEALSFKDALTDVYNRRYFVLRIEEEVKRHARFGHPLSLVAIDVDEFKSINDRVGHPAGDEALQEVARLLTKHSRNFTVVTRTGGDEFSVILVNTPKAGALSYAERIKRVVEEHRFPHGRVTVSLGAASLPKDATTTDDLVLAADRALYEAKRLGRNRVAAL